MRIIPVIDLMGGEVVQAVRGERKSYAPLKSVLTSSADPCSVAREFRRLGLKELYVADLDAICSSGENLAQVQRMVKAGAEIMVDGGFRLAEDAEPYLEKGVKKIVLATETIAGWVEVSKLVSSYGKSIVASIDVKLGRVVAESKELALPPEEVAMRFDSAGVSEILLLSLDRVGTVAGPDCSTLSRVLPRIAAPVLVGGGIRSVEDIHLLRELGCAGVLIATALHTGRITREDVVQIMQSR